MLLVACSVAKKRVRTSEGVLRNTIRSDNCCASLALNARNLSSTAFKSVNSGAHTGKL